MAQRILLTMKRREAKMTQSDLAAKAKISRAYLTNIERGTYNPSLKVAKKISDALDSTIDDIFFEDNVHKMNSKEKEAV